MALQRSWNRKVSYKSGLRPLSPFQQHPHNGPGAQMSLHLCGKQHRPCQEFSIVPFDTPDQFTFSGYFKLASIRTNLRATYGGSDTTPESGRPRVYQDLDPNGSNLYLY